MTTFLNILGWLVAVWLAAVLLEFLLIPVVWILNGRREARRQLVISLKTIARLGLITALVMDMVSVKVGGDPMVEPETYRRAAAKLNGWR